MAVVGSRGSHFGRSCGAQTSTSSCKRGKVGIWVLSHQMCPPPLSRVSELSPLSKTPLPHSLHLWVFVQSALVRCDGVWWGYARLQISKTCRKVGCEGKQTISRREIGGGVPQVRASSGPPYTGKCVCKRTPSRVGGKHPNHRPKHTATVMRFVSQEETKCGWGGGWGEESQIFRGSKSQ